MIDWKNPSWWMTVATAAAAAVGLFDSKLADPVRTAIVSVGGLAVAVYTASHHAHSASVQRSRAATMVAEAHAAAIVAAAKQPVGPLSPASVIDPTAMLAHLAQADNVTPAS